MSKAETTVNEFRKHSYDPLWADLVISHDCLKEDFHKTHRGHFSTVMGSWMDELPQQSQA